MYVFGGFDGVKRNDIYRILFDNEERKKNLQEQENRSFTRSFSMINQSMADLAASSKSVLFGDFSKYIIRMAGGPVYLRLDERFADSLQVGFLAYQRVDGELLSSNAIKVITQAAS